MTLAALLTATVGLTGCERSPGEPAVNSRSAALSSPKESFEAIVNEFQRLLNRSIEQIPGPDLFSVKQTVRSEYVEPQSEGDPPQGRIILEIESNFMHKRPSSPPEKKEEKGTDLGSILNDDTDPAQDTITIPDGFSESLNDIAGTSSGRDSEGAAESLSDAHTSVQEILLVYQDDRWQLVEEVTQEGLSGHLESALSIQP